MLEWLAKEGLGIMQCIKPSARTASEAAVEIHDGTPRAKSVSGALLEMRKNAYRGGKKRNGRKSYRKSGRK
jgi:hypothetical protein